MATSDFQAVLAGVEPRLQLRERLDIRVTGGAFGAPLNEFHPPNEALDQDPPALGGGGAGVAGEVELTLGAAEVVLAGLGVEVAFFAEIAVAHRAGAKAGGELEADVFDAGPTCTGWPCLGEDPPRVVTNG